MRAGDRPSPVLWARHALRHYRRRVTRPPPESRLRPRPRGQLGAAAGVGDPPALPGRRAVRRPRRQRLPVPPHPCSGLALPNTRHRKAHAPDREYEPAPARGGGPRPGPGGVTAGRGVRALRRGVRGRRVVYRDGGRVRPGLVRRRGGRRPEPGRQVDAAGGAGRPVGPPPRGQAGTAPGRPGGPGEPGGEGVRGPPAGRLLREPGFFGPTRQSPRCVGRLARDAAVRGPAGAGRSVRLLRMLTDRPGSAGPRRPRPP